MRDCRDLGICQDRPIRCIGCPMQRVRIIETSAAQWGIPDAVPGVLRAPGGQHVPEPASGRRDGDGRETEHRPLCTYVWPGRRDGIRAPAAGETPLSSAEVNHCLKEGLL